MKCRGKNNAMEEQYGAGGNLMSRDIVSKCIADIPSQVYLDISFLGKAHIEKHLPEVQTLCRDYIGIDVSRESIPVTPSVHFFMGGLAEAVLSGGMPCRDFYAECYFDTESALRLSRPKSRFFSRTT